MAAIGLQKDRDHPARTGSARITLADIALDLTSEGAVWVLDSRTLIVADLHLGKAAHYAARGQMLPPQEAHETLERLTRLVDRYAPEMLILLGDSFHSQRGAAAMGSSVIEALNRLATRTSLLFITGNHDRELPSALIGEVAPHFKLGDIILRHEPCADGQVEIVGHLHPSARLKTAAGVLRRRCFVHTPHRLILPAFGSLTGSRDITMPEFAPWIAGRDAMVYLIAGSGVHGVNVEKVTI